MICKREKEGIVNKEKQIEESKEKVIELEKKQTELEDMMNKI